LSWNAPTMSWVPRLTIESGVPHAAAKRHHSTVFVAESDNPRPPWYMKPCALCDGRALAPPQRDTTPRPGPWPSGPLSLARTTPLRPAQFLSAPCRIFEQLFWARCQLRLAQRLRILQSKFPQLLNAREVKRVRAGKGARW
jgi:hypothetical protein